MVHLRTDVHTRRAHVRRMESSVCDSVVVKNCTAPSIPNVLPRALRRITAPLHNITIGLHRPIKTGKKQSEIGIRWRGCGRTLLLFALLQSAE